MATPINNTIFDGDRDIEFLIPYSRQLGGDERGLIARRYIEEEKKSLFLDWVNKPENQDFSGDNDAKKEELFRKRHRSGTMLLGNALIARVLIEDLAFRLLGSQQSQTIQTDVIATWGYDLAEVETLIAAYHALPTDEQRFEFSKDGTSVNNPKRYGLNVRRK